MPDIVLQIIVALFSSGGLTAVLGVLVKNWITDAVNAAKEEQRRNAQFAREEYKLAEQKDQCLGRCLYWSVAGIRDMQAQIQDYHEEAHVRKQSLWSKELDKAFSQFEASEQQMKALKNEQLSYLRKD